MKKEKIIFLSVLALWCAQSMAQIVASDDLFFIVEDQETIFDVQLNDKFDNPTCQGQMGVSILSSTDNAEVSVESGTQVRYQPKPNYFGVDSFTYRVSSCILGSDEQDEAMVRITIFPKNDPPIAGPDEAVMPEDGSIVIDVQANDFDPDNSTLITIPHPDGASHGTGYVISNDSIFYRPDSNYYGVDTFKYILCDNALGSNGSLCDTGIVQITVTPVGDPLYLVVDTLYDTILEDTEWCERLDTFVIDVDNEKELLMYFGSLDDLVWTYMGEAVDVCYTPEKDFNGEIPFQVEVCDPDKNCVTIHIILTVEPVYDSIEIIHNPVMISTVEEEPICFAIDSIVSNPDGGPLQITYTPPDKMVDIGMDSICYTPDDDFFGTDTIILEICDTVICEEIELIIEVTGTDDPIEAVDDDYLISEKREYSFDVIANDKNPDNTPLQIRLLKLENHLRIEDNKIYYLARYSTTIDSFQYELSNELYKDTAWVYVSYLQVFDGLQLEDDEIFMATGEDTVLDFTENDFIPEGAISFDFIDNPDWVSGFPNNSTLEPNAPLEIDFHYYVCLDFENICDTAKVTITVSNSSEIPVFPIIPNSFSPNEDGTNDLFVIENNEHFQEQRLTIYDRWGDVVYNALPYDNSWSGVHYRTNSALPEGVYYYTYSAIIQSEQHNYSGYIVLKR